MQTNEKKSLSLADLKQVVAGDACCFSGGMNETTVEQTGTTTSTSCGLTSKTTTSTCR